LEVNVATEGTAPAEAPAKEPKLKQQKINGMVPKRIKEIQDAAEALREIREERMGLAESEEKLQGELVAVMKKHGVKAYKIDDEHEAIREAGEERGFVRKIKRKKKAKSSEKDE
jgi:hypothetical protein